MPEHDTLPYTVSRLYCHHRNPKYPVIRPRIGLQRTLNIYRARQCRYQTAQRSSCIRLGYVAAVQLSTSRTADAMRMPFDLA
jgi:hypothetical protein